MVAERRRDTAVAAALDTMVLNRRFVLSSGDRDLVGDKRRFGKLISPSGSALSGVLCFLRRRSVGTNSSSSSPSGGVTCIAMLFASCLRAPPSCHRESVSGPILSQL